MKIDGLRSTHARGFAQYLRKFPQILFSLLYRFPGPAADLTSALFGQTLNHVTKPLTWNETLKGAPRSSSVILANELVVVSIEISLIGQIGAISITRLV